MVIEKIGQIGEGRKMKRLEQLVSLVNTFEPEIEELSDEQLRDKSGEFKQRVTDGESLDDILPEAFASVREAARRTIGQRHFDVQVMGAIALHQGKIAEMKTGEGKTLTSTMPAFLNGLGGEGVHVVTVNDYLAKRDSEWMGPIYRALGAHVGLIQSDMSPQQRRPAYAADITYGTNNEFGFDYLRDNMAMRADDMVQRGHFYAIVDEVDSILIDEARTPLIISGMVADSAKWYQTFARLVPRLKRDDDYEVDEAKKTVAVTESGVAKVESALGLDNLYEHVHTPLVHHLQNALRAKEHYKRDVEYIVQNGEVKIVDEFTGRVLEGRRYSEGLHQAIEAKEGVRIQEEHLTLATITLQNYFRLYDKLGGMTGTAKTEEKEFVEIYNLSVVEIPTNVPVVRADRNDLIFKTKEAKFQAVVQDLKERNEKGQPVLVGTIAVETSEYLSELLLRAGVPHNVLNAKEHEREAEIIMNAGELGAVTIATNMAGRGVDIKLAEGVRELGGLYVVGTERHEARRIDNQLRGRSGRQGDPGETRFYLSGQDDLVRLFAGDRIYNIMNRFKLPDDQPMEAKILSNQIEGAQKKVEEQNFVMRKNVLKYDEVMSMQRNVIYKQRRSVLEGEDLSEEVGSWIEEVVERVVAQYTEEQYGEEWDLDALAEAMRSLYGSEITTAELREEVELTREALTEEFLDDAKAEYAAKEEELGPELMRELERFVILQVVDIRWREHLENMEYMREGVHLRAMAQKDPLVEYTAEGHTMFDELGHLIREEVVLTLFHAELTPEDAETVLQQEAPSGNGGLSYEHTSLAGAEAIAAAGGGASATAALSGGSSVSTKPVVKDEHADIGRNDPCWCGSGKKFKRCHGA